jgi:hypothetical protein
MTTTSTRRTGVTIPVIDRLVVADPCYVETVAGHRTVVIDGAAGAWTLTEEGLDDQGCMTSLCATREGANVDSWRQAGVIKIDTATVFIGCASSTPLDDGDVEVATWYAGYAFPSDRSVVTRTPHGDGFFPVDVGLDEDGRPAAVVVTFALGA